MANFPQPLTSCQLSQFLGLVNHFHCFIPNAASLLQLLHNLGDYKLLLKKIEWTDDLCSLFQAAKDSLAWLATLSHFVASAPLALRKDASATGIGVVLE